MFDLSLKCLSAELHERRVAEALVLTSLLIRKSAFYITCTFNLQLHFVRSLNYRQLSPDSVTDVNGSHAALLSNSHIASLRCTNKNVDLNWWYTNDQRLYYNTIEFERITNIKICVACTSFDILIDNIFNLLTSNFEYVLDDRILMVMRKLW